MLISRFLFGSVKTLSPSYNNLNKLSLKVYYLQEIAKIIKYTTDDKATSYSYLNKTNTYSVDHCTFNQTDLNQLAADVNGSVHDLSPSQLLATAISYSKLDSVGKKEWNKLLFAVMKHVYGNVYNINAISPSHISMILYSYATRFENHTPLTNKLLHASIKSAGSLNERDIAMLLYYMRRTESVPKTLTTEAHMKNAQILRSIALALSKEGGNKLVRLTPSGLVSVVYNFARIGTIPWSLIYHSCNLVKKNASKLGAKCIGFHSRSLAMLGVRDKKTLEEFWRTLCSAKTIPNQTFTALFYALAKLSYRPGANLGKFLDNVLKRVHTFSDGELAQVAYSLGQLGIRTTPIFEAVTDFLRERIDRQSPQHLSMFIRSYAKLGIFDDAVVDLIVRQSLKLLVGSSNLKHGFTFPQLLGLIDSLVCLGHFDYDPFLKLMDFLCTFPMDDLPDQALTQLNRIAYCLRLEHAYFVESSPTYVQTLLSQFQGQFLVRENVDVNESLLRTLKELGMSYRTGESVGPYSPDAILDGLVNAYRRNVTLELLSKGSLCPLTRTPLGSAQMQKRHLERLGYRHMQIEKERW